MVAAWHIFRLSFQDRDYAPFAQFLFGQGVGYRRLAAAVASDAVSHGEYRDRAEIVLQKCFNDDDSKVRQQASEVFRSVGPEGFVSYKGLAKSYVESRAFGEGASSFFYALDEAQCRVDDIAIPATEKLLFDIRRHGNVGGRRTMELHQLQDIIKREYASSEGYPDLRRRLLDLIDDMLRLELYGTDEIVRAHER